MVFGSISKRNANARYLLLIYVLLSIQAVLACDDSYECRFGQQCCKETKTCKANCYTSHRTNIGLIIGIIAAVALGNAVFWVTFCCLCWCKGDRNPSFKYSSFSETERNGEGNNNDDGDDGNDETTKVLDVEDEHGSLREEICLSVIKIKRPVVKPKKDSRDFEETCNENGLVV